MTDKVAYEFLMAFDSSYCRMATSLIRSVNALHSGRLIRVLTTPHDYKDLQEWVKHEGLTDTSVFEYQSDEGLHHGEWHELIWAKLEAFTQDPKVMQIVLDVDQILYRRLDDCLLEAYASGKAISASPDIGSWEDHFHRSPPTIFNVPAIDSPRCFNAGAMIIRPSMKAYEDIQALASVVHEAARLPEQAVLNLWAHQEAEFHDLGEKFMLQPWSPRVLETPPPSCLVHFWTPRPQFFGASPARSGEPTLEELLEEFERDTGQPYPLQRFAADFNERHLGRWIKGPDR